MVRYIDLVEQNAWWKFDDFEQKDRELSSIYSLYRDMLDPVSRPAFDRLNLNVGSVVLLKGPRRVGKTTYLKQLIRQLIRSKGIMVKQVVYINVEGLKVISPAHLRKTLRFYFDKNWETGVKYVFLDEITSCQDWEKVLQGEYDNGPLKNCITFLTGSDPKLLEEGGYKLSGRGVSGNEFLVRPLTFRDFVLTVLRTPFYSAAFGIDTQTLPKMAGILAASSFSLNDKSARVKEKVYAVLDYEKELSILFEVYLKTGGFPEAIHSFFEKLQGRRNDPTTKLEIEMRIYEDILRAILEKLNLVGEDSITAERILRVLSELKRATGSTTYASIGQGPKEGDAKTENLHSQTVEEYTKNLNRWMFVDVIANRGGGYLKKIYIADPFILHSVRSKITGRTPFDSSEELLEKDEERGMLVECVVGGALRASEERPILKETETFLSFYNAGNKEIDFMFKRDDGKEIGIEVKYQEEPSKNEIENLDVNPILVITKKETDFEDNKWFIPAPVFLALLRKSDRHL